VEFKTKEERDNFIEGNLPLVTTRVMKCNKGIFDNDLFQEGSCGLIQAVDRFDASKGFAFSTYGVRYIDGYILTYKNKDCNIRPVRVGSGYERAEVYSLDFAKSVGDCSGLQVTYKNSTSDCGTFTEGVISNIEVGEALERLNGKDRQIVRMIMGGYTQREIGERMGIDQSVVSRKLKYIRERVEKYYIDGM
jgi:RNA polymerase sigma factor (sigma-70 family)